MEWSEVHGSSVAETIRTNAERKQIQKSRESRLELKSQLAALSAPLCDCDTPSCAALRINKHKDQVITISATVPLTLPLSEAEATEPHPSATCGL